MVGKRDRICVNLRNLWITLLETLGAAGQNGAMKPWRIARKDVLGLKFACPDCGQHIDAGREMFGELTECPTCGKKMQVPDLKNAPGDFEVKRAPTPPRPEPLA